MKTTITNIIVGVCALIIGGAFGHFLFPVTDYVQTQAVGDTQATPKMVQVVANPNGSYDATNNRYVIAALVNSNATDRVIEQFEYWYTGLTSVSTSTALMDVRCATSSVATTYGTNTNYVLNTSVATTVPTLFIASTTPGNTGTAYNRTWTTGTILVCEANATSSASAYVKIPYLQQ